MKYSNLPLDITDIIQQMKSRGLSITDENNATTFLENISYFRLAAYLRPMEIDAQHNYKSGATFENAMSLYDFDARLRHLIFGAIQKIEISLRACAHHSRVWNRVMAVMPQLPNTLNASWITTKPAANKLYAILCCLLYWLNAIEPANSFKNELHKLLAEYPNVDTSAMGFPIGWFTEPLWN